MYIWMIAKKDTVARFKNLTTLILALVAPLTISAIMGAAFGNIDDGNPKDINIPIAIVNKDSGPLGKTFETALRSETLASYLSVSAIDSLDAANHLASQKKWTAVIVVPENFSSAISGDYQATGSSAEIAIYPNQKRKTQYLIVKNIVNRISSQFNTASLSGFISIDQLVALDIDISEDEFQDTLNLEIENQLSKGGFSPPVKINKLAIGSNNNKFYSLAFFAPSMAIFFLMFVLFDGMRSIFQEIDSHTLHRLLCTNASIMHILVGKFCGVVLTGLLQFSIFVISSYVFFGLNWGSSIAGLLIMVFAVIFGCSGLGALIVAFSKNANNAASIGTALILISAALGGNFTSVNSMPDWLQTASYFTINRWAIEGFSDLTIRGLGFSNVLLEASVLSSIAIICFAIASKKLYSTEIGR